MFIDNQQRQWCEEFREIPSVLGVRQDLRDSMLSLLSQETPGKVTEGGPRLQDFRTTMTELIGGDLDLERSYRVIESRLPRNTSIHQASNRVFASGWGERLMRTQLSRFYNQAVLLQILASSESRCFIPHSNDEKPDSQCSRLLAGQSHEAAPLLKRLEQCYTMENWSKEVKIPDHPHCTHVVRPSF